MKTLVCAYCGKTYEAENARKITCSDECAKKRKYEQMKAARLYNAPPRICVICGKQIKEQNKRKFCSNECRLLGYGRASKKVRKSRTPVERSIADINALANAAGLSYGQYVAQMAMGRVNDT